MVNIMRTKGLFRTWEQSRLEIPIMMKDWSVLDLGKRYEQFLDDKCAGKWFSVEHYTKEKKVNDKLDDH